MAYKVSRDACVNCQACRDCPADAISYDNGYAKIDENKCQNCGRCANICPCGAISQ